MKTLVILISGFVLLFVGCSSSRQISISEFDTVIIPMSQWRGTAPGDTGRIHTISAITLHHGGVPFGRDKDPKVYLKDLQSWSRTEKKWIDLPYHFLIDLDGITYEGRDIRYSGDTNTEYDPLGHALICVLGNFEEVSPNNAQLGAVVNIMTWLCWKYHLSPGVIKGHKDLSGQTVCPGKNLYYYLENGFIRDEVERRLQDSNLEVR